VRHEEWGRTIILICLPRLLRTSNSLHSTTISALLRHFVDTFHVNCEAPGYVVHLGYVARITNNEKYGVAYIRIYNCKIMHLGNDHFSHPTWLGRPSATRCTPSQSSVNRVYDSKARRWAYAEDNKTESNFRTGKSEAEVTNISTRARRHEHWATLSWLPDSESTVS